MPKLLEVQLTKKELMRTALIGSTRSDHVVDIKTDWQHVIAKIDHRIYPVTAQQYDMAIVDARTDFILPYNGVKVVFWYAGASSSNNEVYPNVASVQCISCQYRS